MAADPNKKTLRHFYCRDMLWQVFETISEDKDRGVDELVNEAMREFAVGQGYEVPEGPSPRTGLDDAPPAPARARSGPHAAPRRGEGGAGRGATSAPLPPPIRGAASAGVPALPIPRAPSMPPPHTARPGAPPAPADGSGAAGPTLYLTFQNQKFRIDKDQFIIGRGSKSSDLPIKDGNISRKHAAVIRRNGTYFIKDLGSTNGIDFRGMRIDNKRIDEGDTFHLCDYELSFSYRRA